MRHPQVHWYEGLFLRPHHFQAADRHAAENLLAATRFDHAHYWGLFQFEYSREALANGQLEIRTLQARLRDGTLIDHDDGNPLDRVDLKQAFESESVVTAYVAVPRLQLGADNVASSRNQTDAVRYHETRRNLQDDCNGGNDHEVSFRELDVSIRLSTEGLSGYETLPIARFRRSGESSSLPEIDLEYVPPSLNMRAWAPLYEDYRDICDIILRKREVLAGQVGGGAGFDVDSPSELERLLLFVTLNQVIGGLNASATSPQTHPFTAYTELCRAVGGLGSFGASAAHETVPNYDHDDLAMVFRSLRERIESSIRSVREQPYRQRYFEGVGSKMQVSLDPEWFHSSWNWLVGVRKGDLTDSELGDLLAMGKLDWKLGSARQVEMLFTQRLPGLQLQPVNHKIALLPSQQEWMYFEVPRGDGPAWGDVQEAQTLAIRFRDSLVVNSDRLHDERKILVDNQGEVVPLEIALFAMSG